MDHSKQKQKEKLSYDGIKDLFSHGQGYDKETKSKTGKYLLKQIKCKHIPQMIKREKMIRKPN